MNITTETRLTFKNGDSSFSLIQEDVNNSRDYLGIHYDHRGHKGLTSINCLVQLRDLINEVLKVVG